MPWTTALANWPALTVQLCTDFRFLDHAAILRFRGDWEKLRAYVADTHDLTTAESDELLKDWLLFRAPAASLRAAA